MQSGRKLASTAGVLVGLVLSLLPSAPAAGAAAGADAAATLRAQRAALVQQLDAVAGLRHEAKQALLGAEQQLAAAEKQLADTRARLDGDNARLRALSTRIAGDERDLDAARVELAGLLRADFVATDRDGFASAILQSSSFSQAMDRVRGAQQVTTRVRDLQAEITKKEAGLLRERAELERRAADAQTQESALGDESGRLLAAVAQRDSAFSAVDGPARTIATRIAAIDDQLNASPPPPPSTGGSHSCGNHFAYGYCTYYVATRRCIPWLGNAWQWWGNAAAYGYPEGHVPQRGAVVVFGRGGYSPVGHVAYVEAVGPDGGVPAGSFLISEMNFAGWNRVNYRTVPDNAPGILGFIYNN